MDVNMEHTNFVAEGNLHCLSYRGGSHHRANRAIGEVVTVSHGVEIVREHDPT